MNEWIMKWLYRYTPDDDQNTVETYAGWIEVRKWKVRSLVEEMKRALFNLRVSDGYVFFRIFEK
jgi:hypothetical protein